MAGIKKWVIPRNNFDFGRHPFGMIQNFLNSIRGLKRKFPDLFDEFAANPLGITFLRRTTPALKDSGVKSAPLFVLVTTEMPGILTELSCLSNDDQARALADPGYRQNIARGLFVGIRAYADVRNRLGGKGSL